MRGSEYWVFEVDTLWNKFEEFLAAIGVVEVGEPVWTITAFDEVHHPREDLTVDGKYFVATMRLKLRVWYWASLCVKAGKEGDDHI